MKEQFACQEIGWQTRTQNQHQGEEKKAKVKNCGFGNADFGFEKIRKQSFFFGSGYQPRSCDLNGFNDLNDFNDSSFTTGYWILATDLSYICNAGVTKVNRSPMMMSQ